MTNEWLWLIMLGLNFFGIMIVYRLFGRVGLYVWIATAVLIANIQVVKTVELFGMTSSLGNIVYATSFLATDIISENYGKKNAGKAVGIGFIALLFLTVMINLALLFEPAVIDFAHDSMKNLYALFPRIAAASFAAYGASQIHDVWAYALLKKYWPEYRWIWLRNNLSTMVSQAIDTLIFVTIAFAGVISAKEFWEIAATTYVFKWITAAADTPLVYLASYWFRRNKIREL